MSLPRLAATEALNLSPDGSQPEIYVSPLLPTGERWQVSASGGQQVQWRADGGELYYLALDNMLMAVPIEDAREFRAGKPASVVRLKSLDIYSSQTGEYDPWRSFEAFEPWR